MTQDTRQAIADDAVAVADLLADCHLPQDGFMEHLHHFLVTEMEGRLIAVAGLEYYHPAALLRSVAVYPQSRASGLAQELVRQLLDLAYAQGIRQVFLLTMTAEEFFPRFGFQTVEREHVPQAMLSSAEFQGACPTSARLMGVVFNHPPLLVRRASFEDVPAITHVYNQGIEEGATFETELRSEQERHQWLENHRDQYLAVVAVRQGRVIGWACLNPFSPRSAYQWVADLSVYVERSVRGTGVGTALMRELERRAQALGFHKLVLTTFPELAAVEFYKKLNYRQVGIYKEQGQLHNRWQDTLLMEKLLAANIEPVEKLKLTATTTNVMPS